MGGRFEIKKMVETVVESEETNAQRVEQGSEVSISRSIVRSIIIIVFLRDLVARRKPKNSENRRENYIRVKAH